MAKVDDVFDLVGHFGRYQIISFSMLLSTSVPNAFHSLESVFTEALPEYHCKVNDIDSLPMKTDERCNSTFLDRCHESNLMPCSDGYYYDNQTFSSTVTTEFNLVCADSNKAVFNTSMFFFGVLFGSIIFSSISDKYGRRFSCILSTSMTFIS